MSTPSNEPENYSIDDMMDRLRGRSSGSYENGELVTRPDGSQVFKVRKRKRRSHQPHKEEERKERRVRVVQITLLMAFVALVLLSAGGILIYHNTPVFRAKLLKRVGEWTCAEAEVTQFRVSPVGCGASTLNLRWPEDNALKEMLLMNVNGDLALTSFLGGNWHGEELLADEARLRIDQPGPATNRPDGAGKMPAGECPFEFRYRAEKLQVILGSAAKPSVRLAGAEASFYRRKSSGCGEIRLNHGTVSVAGWPDFNLDRSLLEFADGRLNVPGLRLLDPTDNKGSIELKGQVSPYDRSRPTTLDLKAEGVALSMIGGESLARLLDGRVDSRPAKVALSYLTFVPGDFSSYRVALFFEGNLGSRMSIAHFSFLHEIAALTGDSWYENPTFDSEATGLISRQAKTLDVEGLRLEARNRLAIRGSFRIDTANHLTGVIEVGLPEDLIRAHESEKVKSTFAETRDNFRWAMVRVSGTTADPHDLLHDLLTTGGPSGGAAAPDAAKEWDHLTNPH